MAWVSFENLTLFTTKLKEWIKTNIHAKDVIQDDQNKLVTKTQIEGWNAKYDQSNTATNQEIEELLTPDMIKEIFELASEDDIRLLFQGTTLEGGETYNLGSLTPDESKMVNMKLLNLYNDLVTQKVNTKFDKATTLQLGKGLTGSADFSKENVSISLNIATNEDIENLFIGGI